MRFRRIIYVKLGEREYDIIIWISLRGTKDGLQITKELRSNPKFHNMPIVSFGHAYQKIKRMHIKQGVDIFITKPVQGHILLESLASA